MRKILLSLTAALTIGTAFAAPAAAERRSPEAQLAQEIEGRVAGDPVRCIQARNLRSRVINRTAIVYEEGSTIYVNRLRGGRDSLNQFDVMVNDIRTSQICSGEAVRMIDPAGGMLTGIVFLDEFVPYRRVRNSDGN